MARFPWQHQTVHNRSTPCPHPLKPADIIVTNMLGNQQELTHRSQAIGIYHMSVPRPDIINVNNFLMSFLALSQTYRHLCVLYA